MKMSDNPTKYEVQFEQYLRSILDISDSLQVLVWENIWAQILFKTMLLIVHNKLYKLQKLQRELP